MDHTQPTLKHAQNDLRLNGSPSTNAHRLAELREELGHPFGGPAYGRTTVSWRTRIGNFRFSRSPLRDSGPRPVHNTEDGSRTVRLRPNQTFPMVFPNRRQPASGVVRTPAAPHHPPYPGQCRPPWHTHFGRRATGNPSLQLVLPTRGGDARKRMASYT